MNIQQWQKQIWDCPNMNSTAVAIALAVGSHGNWNDSQTVWPSRKRISSMTGASRDTVGKYMDALEEQGWLKVVKVREHNQKEYEMCVPPDAVVYGILAIKQRGSKSQLKNQSVVVDKESPVVDCDNAVVVDAEPVVVDYDTNLPVTYQDNLQEELTNTSTTAAGGGTSEDRKLEEDSEVPTTSPNSPDSSIGNSAGATLPVTAKLSTRDILESFLTNSRYTKLEESVKEEVKKLMLDSTWQPHEARPNFRWSLAIEDVRERGLL